MQRLAAAWRASALATFDAAMLSLAAKPRAQRRDVRAAARVARRATACAAGARLGLGRAQAGGRARSGRWPSALDAEVRANTLELIALHGLAGRRSARSSTRLASQFEMRLRLDEGRRRCGAASSPARWPGLRPTC